MRHRKYIGVYIISFILLIVFFSIPIILKVKLKEIKSVKYPVVKELNMISEDEANISLSEIIKTIELLEGLEIEDIYISDEEKEVKLKSQENLKRLVELLEELKVVEGIYDMRELEYIEDTWKITVVFR